MPAALFPLNPFYWGLYGGSEGAAVLAGHKPFHHVLIERGYEPAGTTVLLEADLTIPEPRDPRAVLIRRQTQIEFFDDALPTHWWQNLALGDFQIMEARLLARTDGTPLAHAHAWDMGWFGRGDGRPRDRADQPGGAGRASPPGLRALPGQRDLPPRAREHDGSGCGSNLGGECARAVALCIARLPADRSGHTLPSAQLRGHEDVPGLIELLTRRIMISWRDAH